MINGKIIKVCGMREAENIQDVESIEGIDMLGFIFYPKSPRYVYELPAYLPIHARRVGVFVNEDKQIISMYADRFGLNYLFLFDTKCEQYGGSGNQFDWSILDMYNGHVPFLLSGGINSYSANALKEFKHPRLAGYDLNSRFELKPGEKDPERIRTFLNELKS